MEILFVLVPISLLLVGLAVAAFIWAVNSGQFEDLERHGYEILFDDDDVIVDDEAATGGDSPGERD